MRLLVTGGAGFIGSNFIAAALQDHSVRMVNIDKLTYCGNLDNLKAVSDNPRYSFIKADICDHNAVRKAMQGADAVINFAAESHVDRSIAGPEVFARTNILGTQVLLDEARHLGIKRFIQISTDEVYGSIARESAEEGDALNPSSPYAASKAAADEIALSYFRTYGLPVIITRSSNNFGPYQYPEKLIPLFATNLIEGNKVHLYGSGLNVRDWLHVSDNCSAIQKVLEKGKPGEIYNIASGDEIKNIDIAQKLISFAGKGSSSIEHVADRKGHDFRYSMKTNRIRKLGWRPSMKFGDALEATFDWYKENEWWWKPLKHKIYNTGIFRWIR